MHTIFKCCPVVQFIEVFKICTENTMNSCCTNDDTSELGGKRGVAILQQTKTFDKTWHGYAIPFQRSLIQNSAKKDHYH